MCRRFCCYAYLAPTGSASHWSFEQETEEEQIRGSTLLLQDNATQPMSHHRVNHFDAFQGWLQHQQCCIIQSVMETEGMSIYLFHKRVKGDLINDLPERIFSIHLCTHIICMCVCVYIYRSFHTFHVGIGSRIQRPWVNPGRKKWNCSAVRDRVSPPKSDTVRESNGQSKSIAQWSEAKQPRRALCPSQTLKDFKGAPLWATLHNQLKPNYLNCQNCIAPCCPSVMQSTGVYGSSRALRSYNMMDSSGPSRISVIGTTSEKLLE